MNAMIEKIGTLWPELTVLFGACVCLALGLSQRAASRRLIPWAAALALATAVGIAWSASSATGSWSLAVFIKVAVAGIGVLLVMLFEHIPEPPDAAGAPGGGEPAPDSSAGTSPRGEFTALLLFSLAGAMLCAGAEDLVWLFLALELTSLPTYVLVTAVRRHGDAAEAGVKYFFLGALATATFLYGFALIYGATGSTAFDVIRAAVADQRIEYGAATPLMVTGMVLAVLGLCYKIAAVPMHFYAADVYQGAATPVTAVLAFVPKTAGFVGLIAIMGLVQWQLPDTLAWMLWIIAAATMTVGNVLGLLQSNVKRVLAYSSIAHSGYMIVGLLAGVTADPSPLGNGTAAVLFYLVIYGLATVAAFGVLGCLSDSNGIEAQRFDDIAGLAKRQPVLAAILLIAVLSLLGFPLTAGFLGKIYIFGSAVKHQYIWLVVIAVLNSAVSAVYYLRIAGACYFADPARPVHAARTPGPRFAAAAAAAAAVALFVAGGTMIDAARQAAVQVNNPEIADVAEDRGEMERLSAGDWESKRARE